jgi:hypothetical protein
MLTNSDLISQIESKVITLESLLSEIRENLGCPEFFNNREVQLKLLLDSVHVNLNQWFRDRDRPPVSD